MIAPRLGVVFEGFRRICGDVFNILVDIRSQLSFGNLKVLFDGVSDPVHHGKNALFSSAFEHLGADPLHGVGFVQHHRDAKSILCFGVVALDDIRGISL
jgi:hypothetical protein